MRKGVGMGWALVLHGGAGVIARSELTAEKAAEFCKALSAVLGASTAVLAGGGSAVDAVEAAVRALEDDPLFNAGRGAVFSADGRNELDASIMHGRTRAAGAVAGVMRTKNPVALARRVMEVGPHVLLAGEGADAFAASQGFEQVEPAYFRTEERWAQFETSARHEGFDRGMKYGTVGAVARDADGHLAAATSTGGITGKRWNRVGDTPIIGAGTWADDRSCAVSATGSGEEFLRVGVAHEIAARVRWKGETPIVAALAVIVDELTPIGGSGGVIVMGPTGPGEWAMNSAGMYRARQTEGGTAEVAIFADPA